jgi:hemerythrin-like domain-containing protein
MINSTISRREFFARGVMAGGGLLASLGASAICSNVKTISPIEVLSRDHGLMRRILFIYEEVIRRCCPTEDLPTELIRQAAENYRKLANDFHQKLEDEFLFSPMAQAGNSVDLIDVLSQQHIADQRLTGRLLRLTSASIFKNDSNRSETRNILCNQARMMSRHMAWEESELFPAFFAMVSTKDYRDLSEIFARRQEQIFGCEGINAVISDIADMENTLGIHNVGGFTPAT